ncbi:MAG: pantothenate metabolism flavoprotein [Burkholderiaceae bacterium]
MDERVKAELRVLAARRGVSMEQHARDILEQAVLGLAHDEPFAQRIRQRFAPVAVEVLPLPKRHLPRVPPSMADGSVRGRGGRP